MAMAVASFSQKLGNVIDFDVAALYKRYARSLHQFFWRRSLPVEDIPDFTQEVFVRLLQYSRQRVISHPQAFIFVTASNLSRDFARRRTTRAMEHHVSIDDGLDLMSGWPLPDADCESKESLRSLCAALAELRPDCRESLLSSRLYDKPYLKIAEELGISTSMVEKHVSRAMAHCRERLGEALDA